MGTIIPLTNESLPTDCFVFKHSTACPVSSAAADEVRSLELNEPIYWVNVIEQRPLSNWIAERYKIRHESPQLLRIQSDGVVKVWNHRQIRRDQITEG